MQWLRARLDALRSSFFALPALAVAVAYVAARLLAGVGSWAWVGESTVGNARALLSTVAAATMTFASVAFSVSILVMQQGANQYSPRVVASLTRDPFYRRVIAIVMATFTFCLVTLQRVRGPLTEGGEAVVPSVAVSVSVLLGLIAVLAVVAALNHTSRSMNVSAILGEIVSQSRQNRPDGGPDDLEAGYDPIDALDPAVATAELLARQDGWVQRLDLAALVGLAEPGGTVRVETAAGRYVVSGSVIARIRPAVLDERAEEAARIANRAVLVGPTRSIVQDPSFAVRQLVDVALRALSPGVNDPTTALDAILHLATVLVDHLSGDPPATSYTDAEGRRLELPHAITDAEVADLAFDELRVVAASDPTVIIYLLEMIDTVVGSARRAGQPHWVEPFLIHAARIAQHGAAQAPSEHDRARVEDAYRRRFGDP
jgi:uncharacterized membrane protein